MVSPLLLQMHFQIMDRLKNSLNRVSNEKVTPPTFWIYKISPQFFLSILLNMVDLPYFVNFCCIAKQNIQKNIYFCFIDYAKDFDYVDHNKLWKILKEMGIPDHLTCLLRNLYVGQEATVRTGYGTTDWFQIGKGVCQGCILSP